MRRVCLLAILCTACFVEPDTGADSTATDGDESSTSGSTTPPPPTTTVESSSEESDSSSTGVGCDPGDGPGEGIFVSTDGDDVAGQGTPLLPFATIETGIKAAVAAGADAIYLDEGTYAERVVVPDTATGLRIEGGFVATGATWERDCEPGVVGRTVIAAPPGPAAAVQVFGVTHTSRLVRLTVATASQSASVVDTSGESRIGVHVSDGVFALEDVDVLAGRAGDGGMASEGTVGAPAEAPGVSVTCMGTTDCADGEAGDDGTPHGAPAEANGVWEAMGFVPADGEPGLAASPGQHGTPSAVGPQQSFNCHENCGCVNNMCTDNGAVLHLYGGAGLCGCGGEGGGGGAAGRGGGASVALLIAGASTTVDVSGGSLRAGEAGNGSAGGPGGAGGAGSQGVAGGSTNCHAGCGTGGGACGLCGSVSNNPLMGGAAGGPGGTGGTGSRGGGGAGGDSYAIVRLDGAIAILDPDDTMLEHGTAGAGAGGAPDGRAGLELSE